MLRTMLSCLILAAVCCAPALAATPSAAGAEVYFVSPENGATISNPIKVEFGIKGMEVMPAGDQTESSGHHHLIIDAELPPLDQPVPADDNNVHFGKAQTETTIELSPGEHTLQLLLGDFSHIPHDPPVQSEKITITVE